MELSIKKVTKGRVLARAAEAICASVISLAIFPDTVNSAEPALTAPEVEVIGNYDIGIGSSACTRDLRAAGYVPAGHVFRRHPRRV